MVVANIILGSFLAPLLLSTAPFLETIPPSASAITPITTITIDSPSLSTTLKSKSSSNDYLPRKLYPGTYKNFCGPTPEVEVKGGCAAHGWHGDDAADLVDEACRLHDVSYCQCETKLLVRHEAPQDGIPLLSSLTALRFFTKSTLEKVAGADQDYFTCINQADRQLIATGIQVRGQMQRTGCSTDPSLAWFCDLGKGGTLNVFEKVNLSIFLRDLDSDGFDVSLSDLEQIRQVDLQRQLQSGKSVADAASSQQVQDDENQVLRRLLDNNKVNAFEMIEAK